MQTECMKRILEIVSRPFDDEKSLLAFYREHLPGRVGRYRLDEVGPIMSAGTPEEIAGYLENRFYFGGIGMDMGEEIDWYATPNGDLEWNGGFVRQGHLMYLADEYERTGEDRYAQAVVSQMLDYIGKMPPYQPEGKPYLEYKKSTWRPFEVAGRAAENWPVALAKIIGSQAMTPQAFAKIYYSIYEHAVFLSKYHWRTGNHACLEVAGLGVLCLFYPEFSDAPTWLSYAVDFLMQMLDEEFHADGYTMEMSGAYHWVAMRNFFALYQVAAHNNRVEILPQRYVDYLRRAAFAEFYQQKPDYSLPVTNDSNATTRHRTQLEKLRLLLGDDLVDYRFSEGAKGTPPAHTSFFFPDARVGVMRSDWTQNARYASFDMGRWGTNHMNEDQLNLELSAYGRNLLVNCGRWRYTTSPGVDWLETAQYFKTTAAYNSLLCDGLCQMPVDADGQMTITPQFDYAKGVFAGGYGLAVENTDAKLLETKGLTSGKTCVVDGAVHTREVFFAKPTFFVVRDTLTAAGEHTAQQLWHFAQGDVIRVSDRCVYTAFDDANVILMQLGDPQLSIYKGQSEPLRGWNCPRYDQMIPAPEVAFSVQGSDRLVLETLLFPVAGAVDPANLPLFEATEQGYRVTWQGKTMEIVAAVDGWRLA